MITAKEARQLLNEVSWNDDLQYALDNIMEHINDACLAQKSFIEIYADTDNRIIEKLQVLEYKITQEEYSKLLKISW